MDFGEILSKAWKITWKYKVLWIFGILAGCAESSGGGGNGGGSNFNNRTPGGDFPGGMPNLPPEVMQWLEWARANLALIIIGLCLFFLIITAIRVFFGTIGRIGLIHGAQRADQEDAPVLTFGDIFSQSRRYFWRIFGIDLLVGVVSIAIVLLILAAAFLPLLPAITSGQNMENAGGAWAGFALILFACMCCIFLPVSIVVGIVLQMVYTAIVVDNMSIGDGLRKGWEVFKSHLGNVLIMWLLLAVLGWIIGIVISLPLIAAFLPLILVVMGTREAITTGVVTTLVCCVVYFPVLLVLTGILRTYVQTGWTLTYLRLTGRPANTGAAAVFTPPVVEAPQL